MNISTRVPKREEIFNFLNSMKFPLVITGILIISLVIVSFTVRNTSALSFTVNDFVPNADFGIASNSSKYPNGSLGYFDVLDDNNDGTYAKSSSGTAASGSFGVSYGCPSTCPAGVVTSVKIKLRNARNSSAGINAKFGIELRRTGGSVLGSVTGIPFSGTAPTIGIYEAVITVDPNLKVSPSELATVISWSKASSSGSEVRFFRARLDVTTSDVGGSGDATPPTVSIISPVDGSVFTAEGDMTIQAEANDNVAISRVEFLKDSVLQATDYQTTNPHVFSWHFTSADNGSHSLTVRAFDTASPQLSSEATVSVQINIGSSTPPPPAECIVSSSTDWTRTYLGLTPLADLGINLYKGFQGGLYPNGSNVMPLEHTSAGLQIGQSIQPLDSSGNPSATGKYVLISVGMSNTSLEFSSFMALANADPGKDSHLVLVNGAQSGKTSDYWSNPNDSTWQVLNDRLKAAGVTPAQVIGAWVKDITNDPTAAFPANANTIKTQLTAIAQNLKDKYPNIKLAYYSTRIYGGYTTRTIRREPYAYESGFSVKWMIEDQLNGVPSLNFDPAKGAVEAPWLAWGPYLWADGLGSDKALGGIPGRSDGLEWACTDFEKDGIHPNSSGRNKVANPLLNFFKTDLSARPWFLTEG